MLLRMPEELRLERRRLLFEFSELNQDLPEEEYRAKIRDYIFDHASPALKEYIKYSRDVHKAAKKLGVKV